MSMGWRVHPHSRGENSSSCFMRASPSGSSPLARGKSSRRRPHPARKGFIPTRAGKMSLGLVTGSNIRVHPHSRGENLSALVQALRVRGSSPLARGKCRCRDGVFVGRGFIPTRAGKIAPRAPNAQVFSVHPHSRGENRVALLSTTVTLGSSPLARGKYSMHVVQVESEGFIPTRAGKITRIDPRRCACTVHPHSRGENTCIAHDTPRPAGSSPLARGKFIIMSWTLMRLRFIPTRAGKIQSFLSCRYGSWVHPHSRGENEGSHDFAQFLHGSSPLARGK